MKVLFNKLNINSNKANNFKKNDYSPRVNLSNFKDDSFQLSFKGGSQIEEFSKFLDYIIVNPQDSNAIKTNSFKLQNIFVSCMNIKENKQGKGTNAFVYRLDDKYAFKFNYNKNPDFHEFTLIDNEKFKKLKTWYGAVLVKIGNISILKNANPDKNAIVAGVPLELQDKPRLLKKSYTDYLNMCAGLPQKAFDDIAFDFNSLNNINDKTNEFHRYYFGFDYDNPNNFLISGNAIKIVDNINPYFHEGGNNLSQMLRVLISDITPSLSSEPDKKLFEPKREIMKKCLLSCEKVKLDIPTEYYMHDYFKFAGLDEKWLLAADKILELRAKLPQKHEERSQLLGTYFDKL